MRKIIPLLLFLTLSLSASEKDSIMNLLEGDWLLVKACGGISGHDCLGLGYTFRITFKPDTASPDSLFYSAFAADSLVENAHAYFAYVTYRWVIYLPRPQRLVSVTDSTLALYDDGAADWFTFYYSRINGFPSTESGATTPAELPLLVFPNPTSSTVYLNSKVPATSINLFSINGRLSANFGTPLDNKIDFNEFHLPFGVYLLQFKISGKSYYRQILFQK